TKDAEPKRGSSSETTAENSDLRQKREPKDLPGFPALEPQTVPRSAMANPSKEATNDSKQPPANQPQGREPSGNAEADRVTARAEMLRRSSRCPIPEEKRPIPEKRRTRPRKWLRSLPKPIANFPGRKKPP